jgi:site-specific DNA recombinase
MERTIIYARVSTEDQVEKYGLPVQLRACREYAAARRLSIIQEICDEGVSGVTMDRPGLERLRKLVRDGAADLVLMYDVDRLSRELAHLLILKPELEKHARLEFVLSKFEDSPSGRLFFGIRGVIAQYERELTRERTMRGRRERARAGLIVGGRVAYGYRYDAGRLVLDPERAEIAREIFRRYDAGASMREIALYLRSAGAPTWSGRQWGHSSVRRILTNE